MAKLDRYLGEANYIHNFIYIVVFYLDQLLSYNHYNRSKTHFLSQGKKAK